MEMNSKIRKAKLQSIKYERLLWVESRRLEFEHENQLSS